MIFHISPKLSVARDLPQTYRQTVPQIRPCNSKASITKSVCLSVSLFTYVLTKLQIYLFILLACELNYNATANATTSSFVS